MDAVLTSHEFLNNACPFLLIGLVIVFIGLYWCIRAWRGKD